MKYYKFTNHSLILPIDYEFITDDSVTKEEISAWFKKTYKPSFFKHVEEVDESEIDIIWAIKLTKEKGQLKYA